MMQLSKPQKLIHDMEKYVGGPIAVICGSMLIDGKIASSTLTDTITEIFRLNDALRTRIVEKDGMVCQQVVPYEPCAIDVLQFDSETQLHSYAESCAKEPIPLSGKLCNIQAVILPNRFGFVVKCHHIIGDAWTLTLICSQFNTILADEQPPAFPYSDYVESENTYLQSSRCAKDRAFFMGQFETCDEVTYLADQNSSSYAARRVTFSIGPEQTAQIHSYAKQHNVSPFVLFLTAVAIYFSRVKMNTEGFFIGTPLLNRGTFKEKNTMGMFINTVPVLANIDYTHTFADNLNVMQREVFSVLRHQKFNYNDMLTAIRQEFGFIEQLYDVVLSYQNAVVRGASSKVETTWYHNGLQTESLQIHIDDRDSENAFRIHLDYRTDKFTLAEIERMYTHILNLLQDAVSHDDKTPGKLALLSPDEERILLHDFNDIATDYPRDKCVHTLFEEQVERTPDKVAVIACDRTLTYLELNKEANRIAHGLMEWGVGVGDIVAFALSRDSHLIPAMFGVLKVGAAYLPIDPDYPQDRINYMLQDSQAKLFITEENIGGLLENECSSNPGLILSSENLCYCIYTSGSTGKPKGTLISHRNVANFVQNNNTNVFQREILNNCDYFIAVNSISFDITLQEIHLPLLNGRSCILVADDGIYSIEKAVHLFERKRCGLIITPTKLSIYLQNSQFCKCLKNFGVIMCGAEAFSRQLWQQIREHTNAEIFNGYGPTETTCGVLYSKTDGTEIAIGKPVANKIGRAHV